MGASKSKHPIPQDDTDTPADGAEPVGGRGTVRVAVAVSLDDFFFF